MPSLIGGTVWASRAGVGDAERKFGCRHDLKDCRRAGRNLVAVAKLIAALCHDFSPTTALNCATAQLAHLRDFFGACAVVWLRAVLGMCRSNTCSRSKSS